ncbi:hypothetical protein ACFL6N_04240 [Thermodesulfobacteriota bacterium]
MQRRTERPIIRVIVGTGISSVVTQLLIIREFLAQFQGNEFVIALILFNWLVLGGLGTMLANLVGTRKLPNANILYRLSLCLIAMTPLQIMAIRFCRDLFFIHGASVGFYQTFLYSFLTIAPFCLLLGYILPYSLFVLRSAQPDYPGAVVYMADNLGDVAGGALFSFALVFLATPLEAIFLANLPLLIFTLLLKPPEHRTRPLTVITVTLTFLVLLGGLLLEKKSLISPAGVLAHYQESRYGRITVYQDREQYTLFSDGNPLFSTENLSLAEEAIHYPLVQVENPQKILLISAVGGMMKEVRKYRPHDVDYVELDPEMTSILFEFGFLEQIPNLNVSNQDGRSWLMKTSTLYDAIIVNLPEPETFQVNRFFTQGFYQLVRQRLAPEGIFSFSMAGFDNYVGDAQRQKLSSIYQTISQQFPHVLLLPGLKTYFLCSKNPLSTDIPTQLAGKGIETDYISGFFNGNVTPERIRKLNALMDPSAPVNSDTAPRLMKYMFAQWFAKFSTSPTPFVAGLTILLLLYLLRITREEFVLFSTGFTTMGAELLVIFAFQIFFGYIYLQIGLIVTVFLAGLLPGAWLGNRLSAKAPIVLRATDTLLIVLLGIFIMGLHFAGTRLPASFYLTFGFVVSLACGCQFPVALALSGGGNTAATKAFSADLIGAAWGTLVTSVVLIPAIGIVRTALCLIGLKIISLIIVMTIHE